MGPTTPLQVLTLDALRYLEAMDADPNFNGPAPGPGMVGPHTMQMLMGQFDHILDVLHEAGYAVVPNPLGLGGQQQKALNG